MEELRPVGIERRVEAVEHLICQTLGIGFRLQHQGRDSGDEDGLVAELRSFSVKVAGSAPLKSKHARSIFPENFHEPVTAHPARHSRTGSLGSFVGSVR